MFISDLFHHPILFVMITTYQLLLLLSLTWINFCTYNLRRVNHHRLFKIRFNWFVVFCFFSDSSKTNLSNFQEFRNENKNKNDHQERPPIIMLINSGQLPKFCHQRILLSLFLYCFWMQSHNTYTIDRSIDQSINQLI